MNKQILRYYKKKHRNGRSAFARMMDGAVMLMIFTFASYLWFRSVIESETIAIIVCAATAFLFLTAMLLYKSMSFEKFMKAERKRLEDETILERLQLLSEGEFIDVVKAIQASEPIARGKTVYTLRRTSKILPDTILAFYRKAKRQRDSGVLVLSTAPYDKETVALVARLDMDIVLYEPNKLVQMAQETAALKVSDEDIQMRIVSFLEKQDKRKMLQSQAFINKSAVRYFVCAGILFGVSFITDYVLYYRMLSAMCSLLGTTALFVGGGNKSVSM